MKTEEYMREIESRRDICVESEYLIARLDGRAFHTFTKTFDKPYSIYFRDVMIGICKHLLEDIGFKFSYLYTQSDEISILFSRKRKDDTFAFKYRKLLSILAAEASAKGTHLFGKPVAFDCRLIELDKWADVHSYFQWRLQDAARNCLSGHVYWALRDEGFSAGEAYGEMMNKKHDDLKAMLCTVLYQYEDIPLWQRHGIGLYRESYKRTGFDPIKEEEVEVLRNRTKVELTILDHSEVINQAWYDSQNKT